MDGVEGGEGGLEAAEVEVQRFQPIDKHSNATRSHSRHHVIGISILIGDCCRANGCEYGLFVEIHMVKVNVAVKLQYIHIGTLLPQNANHHKPKTSGYTIFQSSLRLPGHIHGYAGEEPKNTSKGAAVSESPPARCHT